MTDASHITAWADRFAILGDPSRLVMLLILRRRGSIGVTDLAAAAGLKITTVSHALRLLRAHDLVRSERDGRMIRYELTDDSDMTAMLDNVLESAATYD